MSEGVDARSSPDLFYCAVPISGLGFSWGISVQIYSGGVFFSRVACDRFVMDMMCVCGHAWINWVGPCGCVGVLYGFYREHFMFFNCVISVGLESG